MTTRGKPFEEGRSGNPAGRSKGSRSKTALALEALLEGDAEAITRKAVELAKDGDLVAIGLCLDRLIPVRKDRPVRFTLPEITIPADPTKATGALLKAIAEGDITPSEAGRRRLRSRCPRPGAQGRRHGRAPAPYRGGPAMTIVGIECRLRKIERREGTRGPIQQMTDAQLQRSIHQSYRQLEREHGSLAAAMEHFRTTGRPDDNRLAVLIEEDIRGFGLNSPASGGRPSELRRHRPPLAPHRGRPLRRSPRPASWPTARWTRSRSPRP